jgi:predicted mannosyl-3-phosphoglycerate phosphatase (HAD superfamily)
VRLPSSVVYLSIDPFLPMLGRPPAGLDEFLAEMEYTGVPVVWVSARNRFQLDSPRRALGHSHPFIAEGGCGAYIPEGYFNVRADNAVRLGRFMCVPAAELQPAAADALAELSEETAVETVTLAGLSARELARNTGLPSREADWMRHCDFSELFFFAGAAEDDIRRFQSAAKQNHVSLRHVDGFWSIACAASITKCVRELHRLFQRAMRTRAGSLAIAVSGDELLSACDRSIPLTSTQPPAPHSSDSSVQGTSRTGSTPPGIYLRDPDLWRQLASVALRKPH